MQTAKMIVTAMAMMGGWQFNATPRTRSPLRETITYAKMLAPLCLDCSSYEITLDPDGDGAMILTSWTLVARGSVSTVREYPFHAKPEEVTNFADALALFRPQSDDQKVRSLAPCSGLVSDALTVNVTWQGRRKPIERVSVYEGCTQTQGGLDYFALNAAPFKLPIRDKIPYR